MSDEPTGLDSQLGELGIPVVSDPAAANLSQEYAAFIELGKATGHEAQAGAEVAKIKSQIAHIVASVHKSAHPETYYYELDQTYYSATSSTFIGQLLALLGLHSIADAAKGAAASGGYPQLSGRIHPQVQPRLHPAGRHRLLRPVGGHGGAATGVVGTSPRSRTDDFSASTTTSRRAGGPASSSCSRTVPTASCRRIR